MSMNTQQFLTSPLVWHPQTAAEAWQLKQNYGIESVYISGGTLLRTQWESGISGIPKHLIDLSAIRGLNEVKIGEAGLIIGGQVSLQACRTNSFLQRHFPLLTEAVQTIAAPSIRNIATIGGNVASKIGDALPALLGYDAEVIWYDGTALRQEMLSEFLQLKKESLLLSIVLPFQIIEENDVILKIKRFGAYHKIGRREGFTPSIVTAAIDGAITSKGMLMDIRISLGGGQTIPRRLETLEKEIVDTALDTELFQHVYDRIIQLYEPQADLFASAEYRKTTAANVIVAELWKTSRQL